MELIEEIVEFDLNQRQLKQAKLHKDAYGKIVIYTQKGKPRLLNPREVTVFDFGKEG